MIDVVNLLLPLLLVPDIIRQVWHHASVRPSQHSKQ